MYNNIILFQRVSLGLWQCNFVSYILKRSFLTKKCILDDADYFNVIFN